MLCFFYGEASSYNDAIFMDRGVTIVIIDASVLIKNSRGSFKGYKDLIDDELSKFDRVDMVFDRHFTSAPSTCGKN